MEVARRVLLHDEDRIAARGASTTRSCFSALGAPRSQPVDPEQQQPTHSELAHYVQVVGGAPVFDDLAVGYVADRDPPQPQCTAAVVPLGDPAGDDPIPLRDLILDADTEVPVAKQQLVERERLPDPIMPALVACVDVVEE